MKDFEQEKLETAENVLADKLFPDQPAPYWTKLSNVVYYGEMCPAFEVRIYAAFIDDEWEYSYVEWRDSVAYRFAILRDGVNVLPPGKQEVFEPRPKYDRSRRGHVYER